jgi:hypothetical protein
LRYIEVIAGLRAKANLRVISDPNWSKAEGALHWRSQDLLGSLVALKRENATLTINQWPSAIENQSSSNGNLEMDTSKDKSHKTNTC